MNWNRIFRAVWMLCLGVNDMSREMKASGIDWIGSIPKSWNTIKFKYLHGGMNTGEGIDKNFWSNEPTDRLFYTAGINPIRTNYEDFPEWKYTKENDLLLARNGTPYIYIPYSNACYTDHIIRATMNASVNKRFVQYGLQCSIASVVVDSVSLATWSASLWNKQVIAWPSAEEQERIVKFLNKKEQYLNLVIEQTHASIEEYKKIKQSIITKVVTNGIFNKRKIADSGVEWLGNIPEEWKVYRIANLYQERSESGLEELPILTVSINTGVSDREIADEEKERVFVRSEDRTKYKRVYPGDLVYNMMRAWQGAFGAVRVEGMVSPAYVVAKPKDGIEIDSRYMEALLRTSEATEEMHRYSRGIVDFRLRLYWPEFKNIRICLPPIEEQREIADYIDRKNEEIDRLIKKKEQFISELENYKKSLIYEYVTGKKEVPEF